MVSGSWTLWESSYPQPKYIDPTNGDYIIAPDCEYAGLSLRYSPAQAGSSPHDTTIVGSTAGTLHGHQDRKAGPSRNQPFLSDGIGGVEVYVNGASTPIGLPAMSASSENARAGIYRRNGFAFTAPEDLTITGLKVITDSTDPDLWQIVGLNGKNAFGLVSDGVITVNIPMPEGSTYAFTGYLWLKNPVASAPSGLLGIGRYEPPDKELSLGWAAPFNTSIFGYSAGGSDCDVNRPEPFFGVGPRGCLAPKGFGFSFDTYSGPIDSILNNLTSIVQLPLDGVGASGDYTPVSAGKLTQCLWDGAGSGYFERDWTPWNTEPMASWPRNATVWAPPANDFNQGIQATLNWDARTVLPQVNVQFPVDPLSNSSIGPDTLRLPEGDSDKITTGYADLVLSNGPTTNDTEVNIFTYTPSAPITPANLDEIIYQDINETHTISADDPHTTFPLTIIPDDEPDLGSNSAWPANILITRIPRGSSPTHIVQGFFSELRFLRHQLEVLVIDDDSDDVVDIIPPPPITEGDMNDIEPAMAEFEVTLHNGPTDHDVTAHYQTNPPLGNQLEENQIALSDVDFEARSGTITIPAGHLSTKIQIPIIPDEHDEADEQFNVSIVPPNNFSPEKSIHNTATAIIVDDDPPAFIEISDASVTEGDPNDSPITMDFTLSLRDGPHDEDVTAVLSTEPITANWPSDYAIIFEQPFTIPANSSNTTVSVDITHDDIIEGDETFSLNILEEDRFGNPIGQEGVFISDGEGIGTIIDNETPPVLVDILPPTVPYADAGDTIDFILRLRDGPIPEPVTVELSWGAKWKQFIANPDAPFIKTIPANTPSIPVSIDTIHQGAINSHGGTPLSVGILSSPSGHGIGQNVANASVLGYEWNPGINIGRSHVPFEVHPSANVLEGDPGDSTVNYLTYTLELPLGPLSYPAGACFNQKTITAANGSEFPGPWPDEIGGTCVAITPGQSSVEIYYDYTVSIEDAGRHDLLREARDNQAESHNSDWLRLQITEPGIGLGHVPGYHIVFISSPPEDPYVGAPDYGIFDAIAYLDDDDYRLVINDTTVEEGDPGDGTTQAIFDFEIDKPAHDNLSFGVATHGITATPDIDYTKTQGNGSISSGATTGQFSVPIIHDRLAEYDETFRLTLADPGEDIGISHDQPPHFGTATIVEDLDYHIVDVLPPTTVNNENDSSVIFELRLRNGTADQDITVDVRTQDYTAIAGEDYTAVTSTRTIPAGSRSTSVSVPIIDDDEFEPYEQFHLYIDNAPVNASVAGRYRALGSIRDDDNNEPDFDIINDPLAPEGGSTSNNTLGFIVQSRIGPVVGDTDVRVRTVDDTAIAGSDYVAFDGIVTIPDGQEAAQVSIQVIGDEIEEDNPPDDIETMKLHLVDADDTINEFYFGTGSIQDDDETVDIDLIEAPFAPFEGDPGDDNYVTVTARTADFQPVTRDYDVIITTIGDTATGDVDYEEQISEKFRIPAGSNSVEVRIPIIEDLDNEPDLERLVIWLMNPDGTFTTTFANGWIFDDDETPTPPVGDVLLEVVTPTVTEGDPPATPFALFRAVSQVGPVPTDYTISVRTVDDSAQAGSDYVATETSVILSAGQEAVDLPPIDIIPDNVAEGWEGFWLYLLDNNGIYVGIADWVWIFDDD